LSSQLSQIQIIKAFGIAIAYLLKINTMKNIRKYLAITLVTIAIAVLTISVRNAPHDNAYEQPVLVEEWMTMPFIDSIDEPLEVEEWMTRPFNNI